jgi:alkanesulfonate monooxygenase SsuD/methylene tetrahydromethanopterin reductase-like flavin-dependent oxidoreductase (luciferase family)
LLPRLGGERLTAISTTVDTISCQLPSGESFEATRRYAQLAEQLGYDSVNTSHVATWDSLTVLAGLAPLTKTIGLGTAVTPIYGRAPAAMAQIAATVDEMAGGRLRLGLGVGHRETMSSYYGEQIGEPVEEMREYVGIVRSILRAEPPPGGSRWRSTFAFTLAREPREVRLHLAALAPKMLRLAGAVADGVLLWSCPSSYVNDVVVPTVMEERERAGRPADGFEVMPIVAAACHDDRDEAVASLRTKLHRYFSLPFYRRMFAGAGFEDDLAAFDAAAPDRAAQERAIPDRLIEGMSAIGDESGVRAGIERFRAAGATNPVIIGVAGTDFERTLRAASPAA